MDSRNLPERKIEKLYRKTYPTLLAYARKTLGGVLPGEEAVQDTFCIACAKSGDLLGSANPEGWLMETLKFVIKNTRRQQARQGQLETLSLNSEESALLAAYDENDIDVLYGNLAQQTDFQLLKKIGLGNYSMREASEELGITVEACKKRVQRARKRLRKKFKEENGSPGRYIGDREGHPAVDKPASG